LDYRELPEEFLEKMKQFLGEEYPEYLASYEEEPRSGLRVNTGRLTPEQFLDMAQTADWNLKPVPWTKNGFYYQGERPSRHPWYYAGLYYLQEPSAMSPAAWLPIKPGDRVLDLCAAPGGKSTELAAKLAGTGVLFSNDISNSRAKALLKNLEMFGAGNICVTSEAPEKMAGILPEFFDKILVDAPCSGEGMFRRDPVAVQEWSPEHVETCAVRQLAILSSAAQCVREGGILVYSTCTFSTEENEGVVQKFLESHPEFVLEKPNVTFGRPAYGVDAVRIFPMDGGEGHFAARFRRVAPCEERFAPFSFKPDRETQAHAEELYTSLFTDAPGRFQRVRDRVILLPNELPDIAGLSVLRAGVEFGEAKKNRIEPAHGIFMASRAENCRSVLHLTSNDPALFAFLRGEEIPAEGLSGYTAVAADGIVTGFGKASNGVLKNRYPKGLRTHL